MCACVCVCVCPCVCVHMCVCVCMCMCVHAHVHACKCGEYFAKMCFKGYSHLEAKGGVDIGHAPLGKYGIFLTFVGASGAF